MQWRTVIVFLLLCLGVAGCGPTSVTPEQVAASLPTGADSYKADNSEEIATVRDSLAGTPVESPDGVAAGTTQDPAADPPVVVDSGNDSPPASPDQVAGWTPFQPTEPSLVARSFAKAITPTPRSWDGPGFTEVFSLIPSLASVVGICDPVDWWYLEGKSASSSRAHQASAWQQTLMGSLSVFIQIDPYPTRSGPLTTLAAASSDPSFGNPLVRDAYTADALQRVSLYQPKYINLGMEINSYYLLHPEDFANFVSLFKDVRRQIRLSHPDTQVFVSFQYETLMGAYDGKTQWQLIGMFGSDIDAVGITTYPLTFNRSLSSGILPADYYTRLRAHTSLPVILAEIGWDAQVGQSASLEAQATYLGSLAALLSGMDVPLINYNFLFDTPLFGAAFSTMGLLTPDGSQKYGYHAWRAL